MRRRKYWPPRQWKPVSILLVVELAFEEVISVDQQIPLDQVSILLVVELAFEVHSRQGKYHRKLVSILLVVELAFEESLEYWAIKKHLSFNPSCSGIGF